MNQVEFVIAKDWLDDAFSEECVEPLIDRLSLVDIVKRAERRPIVWAGLRPDELLGPLRLTLRDSRAVGDRLAVLRCCCGSRSCSEITAKVRGSADSVTWQDFRGPGLPKEVYTSIGPFEFSRSDFERALAQVTHEDRPVRDRTVLEGLFRGEPEDACEWLRLAYQEAEWPTANEHLPGLLGGLRALNRAGKAISEHDAYRWGREMGFHEYTSSAIGGIVRAANAVDVKPKGG